jgi:hypothetical protein
MDLKVKKLLINAVCAVTTDKQTLEIAKWWEMTPGGRAAAHLDHYLQGSGKDLPVDLAKVLKDDGGVRFKVHTEIILGLQAGKTTGSIPIPQSVYKVKDWQFAIGSMTVNWKFPSVEPDKVHIGFRNQYRWHPNEARISQCIHQAAENLKQQKAADYWQEGSTEITLSLAEWSKYTPRFHLVKAGDSLSKIESRIVEAQQLAVRVAIVDAEVFPDLHSLHAQVDGPFQFQDDVGPERWFLGHTAKIDRPKHQNSLGELLAEFYQ